MTNQWTDIADATLLLVFSNPTENHPGSSAWVIRALDKGAKAYVIDPRRTRLAAMAENWGGRHIRIRPGTDIAFVNGVMRYVISKIEDGTIPAENFVVKDSAQKNIFNDTGTTTWPQADPGIRWPWYTDAGFLLKADQKDYFRYGVDWDHPTEPCPLDANYSYFKNNPSEYQKARNYKIPVYTGRIDVSAGSVAGIDDPDYVRSHGGVVFQYLKQRVAPYTPSVVVDICAKVRATDTPWWNEAAFVAFCEDVVNHAWAKNAATYGSPNYRATTILYAMGTTQHTHGSQNVRAYAILQALTGNLGIAGGGVNALRGISNVQGSTDMGLLQNLIPGYSAVPGNNYDNYIQTLFGNSAGTGIQQQGFKNMTYAFFHSNPTNGVTDAQVVNTSNLNDPTKPYGYWPGTGSALVGGTTNRGIQHRTMFAQMNPSMPWFSNSLPRIKALVCWGMNPVQSESNSAIYRQGLKGLELLVVVDMFLTETAEAEVGENTKVYFLPAAGWAEKAGTLTNSARVIQWRWQVVPPMGNSKTDMEILALFAYSLIQEDALNVNTSQNPYGTTDKQVIWNNLFRDQYFPGVNNPFTDWSNDDYQKDVARHGTSGYAEMVYMQMTKPLYEGGTVWIYSKGASTLRCGWDPDFKVPVSDLVGVPGAVNETPNRSQSRNTIRNTASDPAPKIYPNWGHCWLFNRRILYNRNDLQPSRVPGDVTDLFVAPDRVARLFVHQSDWDTPTPVTYSLVFRSYSKLAETYGATPLHEEPKETPRPDLAASYPSLGSNSLVSHGSPSEYPLVLTTIRYVEHYQGGPMSRNTPYLTELVPEPVLEVNSADAAAYGLVNGGVAYIRTARSKWAWQNGVSDPYLHQYGWVGPFRVRIIGTRDRQRVSRGVIAVPFHWGSKGLVTGPSANLLTNDAQDPNTWMPESKSCLCQVSPTIKP